MNAIKVEKEEGEYDDMLNEVYGDVEIAGLSYATAYALKNIDETAYRVGFNDWESGQEEVWRCGECDTEHSSEEEAEECCKEDEEKTT